jgi:hypothetical protein
MGVRIEAASLESAASFAWLVLILLAASVWAWRGTAREAASPIQNLQFEEVPVADIHALDLRADGLVLERGSAPDAIN